MSRNSKVILAKNIKLDKNYKSVLKYTESQMIELMSNSSNLVYQSNTCSFIREENKINIKATYGTCIQANYIAFQNPDYSNKWFFGFIDNIRYLNNGVCEVYFTTDIFTTWFSYWSPRACFTIREHVVDDTIGLHTVPEGLETGGYFPMNYEIMNYGTTYANPYYLCVGLTDNLLDSTSNIHQYNRVYSGLQYIVIRDQTSLSKLIEKYDNASKKDALYCMFMIPGGFIDNGSITWSVEDDIYYYPIISSEDETNIITKTIARPLQLGITTNKYTPKNNKLLTGEYNYIILDNMSGTNAKFEYEYFQDPTSCTFKCVGAITPGCSLLTYPTYYKGINNNISEGILNAKMPICGWNSDVYTNWLTQNGVNIALSLISGGLQVAGGIGLSLSGAGALAGASNITSGAISIASTVGSMYEHSLAPNQAEGNINNGDVIFALNRHYPTIYRMTIKEEYAKICDDFLSRMGYKVNTIKVPNMQHRENFNFVQVGAEENLAYPNNYNNIGIPASALNQINDMFRSGITLWNNHTNFGDYSVSNDIV